MLAKRSKPLFLDKTDAVMLAARTSSPRAPLVVEEIAELALQPTETDYRLLSQAKSNGLIPASISVSPTSRFLKHVAIDAKRLKEPASYYKEILEQQCSIDPATHRFRVLNASNGLDVDPTSPSNVKEAVICGASVAELDEIQDAFIQKGVYPSRLEIASVSMIDGLVSYIRSLKITDAVLVLELLADQTLVRIVKAEGVGATRILAAGFNSFLPIVRGELGLRDDESARKVFFSNSFDFTTMGSQLIRKLVRDLQSAVGFYEVQTGQAIGHVFMPFLPANLRWLARSFGEGLGVGALEINYQAWLQSVGVTFSDPAMLQKIDARWLPLFSMMADTSLSTASA